MLQALLETINPRVVPPGRNGPPKAPLALRVSATRQGVTGTKLSAAVKVADTVCAEFMVTTHAAVPEHAPPHPPNPEPAAGVAVIVTMAPLLKLAEQVLPQLMDPSPLLTVPLPVPCLVTCNVKELTVKLAALVAVPSSVVTVMAPVVAAPGTVVVIVPELLTVNVAGPPLNETAVAPVKAEPVIVTPVPTGPKVGVNGVKLMPSRKATMSSAAVGPIAVVLIGPENRAPGEVLKKDEL